MLARTVGECREGQIPRPLGRKEQARSCPVACCGVFDLVECDDGIYQVNEETYIPHISIDLYIVLNFQGTNL